jgi:solute carrier family 25, member 39/40
MAQTVLAAATVGSVASVLICTPFDVVKNYWQGSPSLNHKRGSVTSRQVFSEISSEFGIRGFWRGTGVALLYNLPSNVTYFYFYEKFKGKHGNTASAALSRSISVLLFSPLEFLRTKVQACIGQPGSHTAIDILKRVSRDDSLPSLWRGAVPTLLRDVPFSMIYFTLYEFNRKRMDNELNQFSRFANSFANGGCCAAVATFATHPLDLIKTQLQSYERRAKGSKGIYTTGKAAKALYAEYGIRGLFTIGLHPRLAKVIPASAIMIATFEVVSSLMDGF